MCKALEVSRSGYYKWRSKTPSQTERKRKEIIRRIVFHFEDSEHRYGSPKITKMLHKEGYNISERTVTKYMQILGLRSCVSRKFRVQTTDSNHDNPIAPNLVNQHFTVAKPNKIWVADITYIPCRQGRLYLASILDLCTKEIVGWRLGERMNLALVTGALDDAYKAKKPEKGIIHHSDRGSQYTAVDYQQLLQSRDMVASMSRKGNCYDNACIESFHSILKKELIYCKTFKTKQQAYDEIYRYLEFFYNRKRIHGSIDYLIPVQFAKQFQNQKVS
jgi:transposase InsO family protein